SCRPPKRTERHASSHPALRRASCLQPAGRPRISHSQEEIMLKKKIGSNAITSFALLVVLGMAYWATAQDVGTTYTKMAPLDQYLTSDQAAEISLARSAAPESISRDAEVQV